MADSEAIPAQRLGAKPMQSARVIAENAVPEINEAFRLMGIPAACYAAGMAFPEDEPAVQRIEGLVHIAMHSSEAYELARWVRSHATHEEATALLATQEKEQA
ncbi:hypothetical protein [Streptomyces sp. NPDC051561]|uniref:hypothetical protein n=1 Tax=Streptomyces sp. NPDC051561 TaxID=3365658 RepID=UPI0037AB92F6